jgi:hypothetical protein
MTRRRSVEFVTAYETWLSAATLVLAAWLAMLFLEASLLPGLNREDLTLGLPASIVLFGIGFGLFVRAQSRP